MRNLKLRCRLSDKAKKAYICRGNPDRLGWILGFSRDGRCYTVQWDGKKGTDSLHTSFLEFTVPNNEPNLAVSDTTAAQ